MPLPLPYLLLIFSPCGGQKTILVKAFQRLPTAFRIEFNLLSKKRSLLHHPFLQFRVATGYDPNSQPCFCFVPPNRPWSPMLQSIWVRSSRSLTQIHRLISSQLSGLLPRLGITFSPFSSLTGALLDLLLVPSSPFCFLGGFELLIQSSCLFRFSTSSGFSLGWLYVSRHLPILFLGCPICWGTF